jgi:prepilin-type N-terminal cleavage/methylation domain-containing protein
MRINKLHIAGGSSNQKGFTLIEVLLTIGLMAMVLVGFMQLFIYCAALSSVSGSVTMGVTETENKLEEISNHAFENILQDYTDSCPCADGIDNDSDGTIDFDGYIDPSTGTVYAADTDCTAYNASFATGSTAESVAPTGILTTCSGSFALSQLNGTGAITIDVTNLNLYDINVSATWQDEKSGRTMASSLSGLKAKPY